MYCGRKRYPSIGACCHFSCAMNATEKERNIRILFEWKSVALLNIKSKYKYKNLSLLCGTAAVSAVRRRGEHA